MSFWTSDRITEATNGKLIGKAFTTGAVNTDTRTIGKGEFFIALAGENFDGHQYLTKAAERGAVAALVSYIPDEVPQELALVKVSNTLEALQEMARYRRAHTETKILAITGSVGKTSAKEMLKLALSEYGETYATSGNYNNHIGLPITLCNMPETNDYAILEMGMNHAGEISFLSKIAKPEVALITNVEAVHLEFFDSVEAIAHAKAEIFEGMAKGVAVLPIDNVYYQILKSAAAHCEVLNFGESVQSTLRLVSADVEYEYANQLRSFKLATHGAHWPKAALGVLACVAALGLPLKKAEHALSCYQEQKGRGAVVELPWSGGKITLMDDAYNASPVSMAAALATLATLGQGRKLAILGEMLELGETSAQLHASMAEPIAQNRIDAVVTVGAGMQPLTDILPSHVHLAHFANAEDASARIETLVKAGDAVLCKGSHGSGVHRFVGVLKQQQ
ncbi:MAG: UDP-N-acetylmuramoyl-tripeptide--D-alanyl-D-alanine ligase [Rickettsiales bacterium]|nr:UDP-N-acetylmuramoyl-tripeptide--D-alanyl-D-alanine ligase [Rickettsiales bacterium]